MDKQSEWSSHKYFSAKGVSDTDPLPAKKHQLVVSVGWASCGEDECLHRTMLKAGVLQGFKCFESGSSTTGPDQPGFYCVMPPGPGVMPPSPGNLQHYP